VAGRVSFGSSSLFGFNPDQTEYCFPAAQGPGGYRSLQDDPRKRLKKEKV